MTEKITREIAENEFQRWADLKRLRMSVIEKSKEHKDARENIIDAIIDGTISITEKGEIIQKLAFDDEPGIKELTFKPRLMAHELSAMNRAKTGDDAAKSRLLISKLTNTLELIIGKLDSNDVALSNSIAGFYYLV